MALVSGLAGGKEKIMFISTYEKNKLFNQLDQALKDLSMASSEITVLKGKVKALEANTFVLKETIEQNKHKPKKTMTHAQRAKQREYMRNYKARKKAEKAAQLAQAVA